MKAIAVTFPIALLALAACSPAGGVRAPATPVRLDCPAEQDQLRRVSAAADGKSCEYRGGDTEVSLRLVPVTGGSPDRTLAAIEQELNASPPPAAPAIDGSATETADDGDVDVAIGDHARVVVRSDDNGGSERTKVDLPGIHVDTGDSADNRERTSVDLPGLHVDANDNGAKVQIAGFNIDANDDGAVIRKISDVRLRGEAFSRQKRGVSALYIRAGDAVAPSGFDWVGYQARGPRTGPLTVAVMRARGDRENGVDSDDMQDSVRQLIRRNAR